MKIIFALAPLPERCIPEIRSAEAWNHPNFPKLPKPSWEVNFMIASQSKIN